MTRTFLRSREREAKSRAKRYEPKALEILITPNYPEVRSCASGARELPCFTYGRESVSGAAVARVNATSSEKYAG